MDTEQDSNLSQWIGKLSDEKMPVFTATSSKLTTVSGDTDSSASELARIILQDASMTARVLKAANSIYYNPTGRSISTISRAVVVLGFETVRSLCLSIAMIESTLQGNNQAHVAQEMSEAFHAAVQARSFAEKRRDRSPEEVYVATLLRNLGRIAFWCFAEEDGESLERELNSSELPPDLAEKKVLGFTLQELSFSLAQEWHLGELLEKALGPDSSGEPRTTNISMGYDLARSVDKGWNSPETRAEVKRIAASLYLSQDQVEKLVKANAKEAAEVARMYGAAEAGKLIPQPGIEVGGATAETRVEREPNPEDFNDPDPMLQLEILRELAASIDGGTDINLLIEMVLEGISRGIGMDRVLFAMATPDRKHIKARYTIGWDALKLKNDFVFEVLPESGNIFRHLFDTSNAVYVNRDSPYEIKRLVTENVQQLTGGSPFFAMPATINGRTIGVFYADRKPSKRELDEQLFASFKHFGQQAVLGITHLSAARK